MKNDQFHTIKTGFLAQDTPLAPVAAPVAVIGLGYVGLPLAVRLAETAEPGQAVIGFDIDSARIAALRAGHDATGEVSAAALQAACQGALRLGDDPAALATSDIMIVTVPTPVDGTNKPDLSPLERACRTIGSALRERGSDRPPAIIVFESTVYPGVTEQICGPWIAETSGLISGKDFFLGYSPERINPGDPNHRLETVAKIVAGETPSVTTLLANLYGRLTRGGIFIARDIRTAEAAKVIENAQRDINIAFINEVAAIFHRLGLSVYDVLDAARTKWNFLDFKPGLVGGHCIGVDPYYLAQCAIDSGHDPQVILAGRRINDGMGRWLASEIAGAARQTVPGAKRALVLGMTFKENIPDIRNSRSMDLVRGLEAAGFTVDLHDPHVDPALARHEYGITLQRDLSSLIGPYDVIVLAVAHDSYRRLNETVFARLAPNGLLADIKGFWHGRATPAGLRYWRL